MRPRTLVALSAVGCALAALPASGQAIQWICGGHAVCATAASATNIGTGSATCTLAQGADCSYVVHKWTAEFHGNARRAKFTKADLRGADFRGADFRGADFRGVTLRHADLRDANLKGARFDPVKRSGRGAHQASSCFLTCAGADLAGANLAGGNMTGLVFTLTDLSHANLEGVNLSWAILRKVNLRGANLRGATITGATFTDTDLTSARFTGATVAGASWNNTTCPDGSNSGTNPGATCIGFGV